MRSVNGIQVYSEMTEILTPAHTALLVVDMQNDFVHPDGWFAREGRELTNIIQMVPNVTRLLPIARCAGVLPIFIEQVTLSNSASDPPAWLYFKTRDGRRRTDYTIQGSWGQSTADEVGKAPSDLCIEKRRPSAFHKTALNETLGSHSIESVAVCGVVTQGCVQATVLDASFHNYYTVVIEDCVQSFDQPLHDNALTFMRSRYDVVTLNDLQKLWAGGSGRSIDP
jgi:nicotinamidase-related amidase